MKSEIVSSDYCKKEIDWSKPQLVVADDGLVVLTNGEYSANNFEGTVLVENTFHPSGRFVENWVKRYFNLVQGEITIKFSND